MQRPMTLETIRERLTTAHLPDVQRSTGLAYNTLKNIRDGKSVFYHTVVQLSNHFHHEDSQNKN